MKKKRKTVSEEVFACIWIAIVVILIILTVVGTLFYIDIMRNMGCPPDNRSTTAFEIQTSPEELTEEPSKTGKIISENY